MSSARAVLLDTDIGSDIDDAVALAYLLDHPDCDLVGITTVTGDVQKRAACAEAICHAAGRTDIEIRAGTSGTVGPGPGQPAVPQYNAIAEAFPARGYGGDAVDFMRATIRSRPGEITLLSIGPLTNIAALFACDPGIVEVLGGFVSMAGIYFDGGAEWNAKCDPLATTIVFHKSPPDHLCVGLDVTVQCRLPAEQVRTIASPVMQPVLGMAEVWFRQAESITLHDPLAAALMFRPELCEYARGTVSAEAGVTRFAEDADGRHVVARTVDAPAAVQEILERVSAQK